MRKNERRKEQRRNLSISKRERKKEIEEKRTKD